MKRIVLFSVLFSAALFSCQKEIKIDLNEANPKVIIEANYSATDSTVKVIVSRSSSYFDVFEVDFINDAFITIREENGTEVIVPFIADGTYELSGFPPVFGSTYTLKVLHNNTEYVSDSKLMPVMELLPSRVEFQEESIFSSEGYWVFYRFQDFSELGNCYKLVPSYYGSRYDKFGEFSIGNDNLTDGNLVERPLLETFQLGDTVYLELQSINQKIYDYYNQLSSSSSGFNAAVGNPDYLWSNGALGYFSAYGYSTDMVIITE